MRRSQSQSRLRLQVIGAAVVLCGASAATAQILFEHLGSSDPVAVEGWEGGITGPGVTVGPISTVDPPVDAWFIHDNSSELGSGVGYARTLNACEAAAANAYGWTLRVCLRVNDPDSVGSIWCGFGNGSRRYSMWFRTNVNGEPIVTLQSGVNTTICVVVGTEHTVSSPGTDCHASGFQLYELAFDPNANSVEFLVDGVSRATGYTGLTLEAAPQVSWGSGSSCATGYAEFRLLQFELHAPAPVGDLNCDCVVTPADIPYFVTALIDPDSFDELPGACQIERADMNQDAAIDGSDVAGFVSTVID